MDGSNIEQIWTPNHWPQKHFRAEYPDSRLLIFQRGFRAEEDLRATIQRLGSLLVDALAKFRNNTKVIQAFPSTVVHLSKQKIEGIGGVLSRIRGLRIPRSED